MIDKNNSTAKFGTELTVKGYKGPYRYCLIHENKENKTIKPLPAPLL